MIKRQAALSVGASLPGYLTMSSQRRTFVLQAVSVAVVVGVIFFAFLRPSELGELSGIEAPGGDGPTFVLPGDAEKRKNSQEGPKSDARKADRRDSAGSGFVASLSGPDDGSELVPTGNDPTGDQYTSTAAALLDRIRAAGDEVGR